MNGFRPHMAHMRNTLVRKDLANKASDKTTSYDRYKRMVDASVAEGWSNQEIVHELESEIVRIEADEREGDVLFQQGLHNAKVACISSIRVLISELKGE